MYFPLLVIHSWGRWIVLALFVLAIWRAAQGAGRARPFTRADNRTGAWLLGMVHLQFLVGLALYLFFSPVVQAALADMGAAMKDANTRFWAVEHITLMFVAVAVASVGRARSKKAATDTAKHKAALVFYSVALLLMLLAIPFLSRPLLRI